MRQRARNAVCATVMLLASLPASALVLDTALADPAQEAQAQTLFHGLRCVVCEGQSLADSDATFAVQMRADIRSRLQQGDTAEAIRTDYVARYGASILMQPPLNAATALLWAMPALLVILGSVLTYRRTRHRPNERS